MDNLMTGPLTTPEDVELVQQLREQPGIGVARLIDRYGRLVYSVALRILQDHRAAEEVTQDVFVRCWSGIDRYQPERARLVSWLLTIAHHRAIDELRSRRGKSQRREISADHMQLLTADEPAFDDALLRGEIRVALAALPQPQREVIIVIFWGGLTRHEAAAQLSLPLGTVCTRLRLGMDKLRGLLGQLFGDERTIEGKHEITRHEANGSRNTGGALESRSPLGGVKW